MESFDTTSAEKAANAAGGAVSGAGGAAKAGLSMLTNVAKGASIAGMVIEAGKVIESIAAKNEKKMEESLEAADKAREGAISEVEKILEDMKDTTGEDLKRKQQQVSAMLTSIKKPQGFGKSQMRGMELQNDIEKLATRFGATDMSTLKPYNTYRELIAGTLVLSFFALMPGIYIKHNLKVCKPGINRREWW